MSSRPSRGAARLAAILDALPDGLLLVNCNGTVVNANTGNNVAINAAMNVNISINPGL